MSENEKGKLIGDIIEAMKQEAGFLGKPFDSGDMFFSLVFKNDKDLNSIARLCGAR